MTTIKNLRRKCKPIDSKVLKSWKLMLYDTTYGEISAKTGLTILTIGNAFRTGAATSNTITKLSEYFNEFGKTA